MKTEVEYAHYFYPFKIGDMTDKGKIEDLFFLQFGQVPYAYKRREPEGKGILMATINGKDFAIGDLKLLNEHE